jgi:hypothetical protein
MLAILGAVVASLILYPMRFWWPLLYGLIEVCMGLGIAYFTFNPTQNVLLLSNQPPWWQSLLSQNVVMLGAIYVMVQGFDDIHKGLPSRWKECLTRNARRLVNRL